MPEQIINGSGTTLGVGNRDRNSTTTAGVIDTSTGSEVPGAAMSFDETDMGGVTSGSIVVSVPLGAAAPGVQTIGGTARAT